MLAVLTKPGVLNIWAANRYRSESDIVPGHRLLSMVPNPQDADQHPVWYPNPVLVQRPLPRLEGWGTII